MKLKSITLLILTLAVSLTVRAGSPQPITVAIFEFSSNVGNILHRDFTSLVTADLSADPHLILVERGVQLKSLLGEEELGLAGNINPDSAPSIGLLAGAKVLVTGRVMDLRRGDKKRNDVIITASVVGAETGRMYAHTVQGALTNLPALAEELSRKIAQTIVDQSTNFVVDAVKLHEQRLAQILGAISGKARPAVSVKIGEQVPGSGGAFRTAETELQLLLQKAGFVVVDEKSDRQPDILITGDAVATTNKKTGNLFSCEAALEIKAQERATGKIISVDGQEKIAVDIGEPSAAHKALQNATDDLAERLLPLLAQ